MARWCVRMAAVMMVVTIPNVLWAEPEARPRVTVSRSGGAVTIAAHADRLLASHTLTPRTFTLTLAGAGDRVRIDGNLDGRITVQRAGSNVEVSLSTATMAEATALRDALDASPAVAAFDELMASPWAQEKTPAATLAPVHALVGLLRGNAKPVAAMASAAAASATPRVMTVAQRGPRECWDTYSRDVVYYTYELQHCVNDSRYTWNPFHLGWCAYEYNLKATMAGFWYLNCSGT